MCGALISALVPGNIVLSAKGDALAGTGSFAEPSGDVLLGKGRASEVDDGAKSKEFDGEENENLNGVFGNAGAIGEKAKNTKDSKNPS